MKIISTILIVIGFLISGISSLIIFYATFTGVNGIRNSETAGISGIAWGLSTAYLASFVNLFGFAILGIGVLLLVISMFTGRKQQQQATN
jgi:hypothetical protein